MKTTDLFKSNRSASKLNESFERMFGQKLKLEDFDLHQLQDARNKLRTQISQVRSQSGFNETIENDALTKAQWMLDAINSEIAHREEYIIDDVQVREGFFDEMMEVVERIRDQHGPDLDRDEFGEIFRDMIEQEYGAAEAQQAMDDMDVIWAQYTDPESDYDDSMDGDHDSAMASAGFGSDEDYGYYGNDEDIDTNEAYINSAKDAVNILVDIRKQSKMAELGQGDPVRPNQLVNDLWDVITWIEANMKESTSAENIEEKAPPGAKAERMVKHIKKGYAKDGKLTDKERGIAYATAWKHHNKSKSESTQTGEDMKKLTEGEIQQAQSIVTAKTMVDRVGRWIEELSGMENDTLLQLGDQIRDEMGQEQAKNFISAVAPAIQQALENLKTTRETLATGVRTLTGEEQAAGMLGAEPSGDLGGDMGPAEPDAMNAEPVAGGEDEFAAAEPAAGGLEDTGREQRESIQYQNRLLKVLAG